MYFAVWMSGTLAYLSIPQPLAPSHRVQVFIWSKGFRHRTSACEHRLSIAIPVGVSGASKFNGLQGWRVLKQTEAQAAVQNLIAHVTLEALIPSPPHPVAAGLPVRLTKA